MKPLHELFRERRSFEAVATIKSRFDERIDAAVMLLLEALERDPLERIGRGIAEYKWTKHEHVAEALAELRKALEAVR